MCGQTKHRANYALYRKAQDWRGGSAGNSGFLNKPNNPSVLPSTLMVQRQKQFL